MHVHRPARRPAGIDHVQAARAGEQLFQRDARFQARERGAKTEMNAMAKPDVRNELARHIEPRRIRKAPLVTFAEPIMAITSLPLGMVRPCSVTSRAVERNTICAGLR